MISESASEQSNMSPSPPAAKSTKLNANIKAHHKTNLDQDELNEHHSKSKKYDYLSATNTAAAGATTQSAGKKKYKSTQHNVTKHINNHDDEDEDNEIDGDRVRKKHSNSSDCNNRQSSARSESNTKSSKSKSNHNSGRVENSKHERVSKDLDIINSHRSKCPNSSDDCNTSTTNTTTSTAAAANNNNNPSKKIKKEKKRYQEMVIDGFTITAFRTWEDLQDEMNERISANIKKNASQNAIDSEMPNTSCSSANSFPTATGAISQTNNQADNATPSTPQPKQSSSKTETLTSCGPISDINRCLSRDSARLDQIVDKTTEGGHLERRSGPHHVLEDRKDSDRVDKRHEHRDDSSLLHKSLRRGEDRHEPGTQDHDKSQYRQEYHKTIRLQSTRDTSVSEARQHHTIPPVNSNYPYGSEPIHERYHSSRPNDADLKRSTKAQFDSQRTLFSGPTMIPPNSYPRRSPSPPPPPPPHLPPSAQTAQQYFQQYHQLYKQMHNSAQQLHQQPHHALPPQPPPHLQNPYLALMNFPNSAHLKGPAPPPLPPLPPPPPAAMPMPNAGTMMGASPFNSPYTITDTIISRQTSIIPSGALPPMPSSLEHLAGSRFTRQQHLSALEQSMGPQPGFGQLQNPGSYMPTPTERSFMEFARSYANASNMSSGYGSFINHPSIPKSTVGPPNFYGHLERMTMDHQQRSVLQGFGASGSNPFAGFNPAGRPPISMFPPHYYP